MTILKCPKCFHGLDVGTLVQQFNKLNPGSSLLESLQEYLYRNNSLDSKESSKITNIVECVNCGQYLRVPKNFNGNIHCTKCHTRFKLDHQETDHDSDSDSS